MLSKVIGANGGRNKVLAIFGGATIVFFTLTGVTASPNQNTKTDSINSQKSETVREEDQSKQSPTSKQAEAQADTDLYEKISYDSSGIVENIYYLYLGSDKSEKAIDKLARDLKSKDCKKQCNISIYDDRSAINLDLAYKKLTSLEEQNNWKEKNYIYVADHLLGFLEFEGNGIFFYYPYKDWYYKDLKNKQ